MQAKTKNRETERKTAMTEKLASASLCGMSLQVVEVNECWIVGVSKACF